MEQTRFTRAEIAEMIGKPRTYISALCSKSRKGLIPDPKDSNIIDITVEKNHKYIQKKLNEKRFNVAPARAAPGKRKKEVANVSTPKQETRTKVEESKEEKVKDEAKEKYLKSMADMEAAKLKKAKADADLKVLELRQKKGDLISSAEIVPFVTRLSKKRDTLTMTNTLSLIKDLMIEYNLPGDFAGRFEREFVRVLNGANDKAVKEFKTNIA